MSKFYVVSIVYKVRISELCKLELKHVDFTENLIFIKEAKGQRDRIVTFSNKLKDKLFIYLDLSNDRYVFEFNRNSSYLTEVKA